jgi:hypothetical protein
MGVAFQEAFESLGISVVGGVGHPRGDIPIYVTNLQTGGCLGRTKLIQVRETVPGGR